MAITDELRSGVANYPFRDNRDFALFEGIADRIDAAHERLCSRSRSNGYGDGFTDGFNDIESWVVDHEDAMAEHGWYQALDADKEPIKFGDEVEWRHPCGSCELRHGIVVGIKTDKINDEMFHEVTVKVDRFTTRLMANQLRHYHKQPTVEDILREFGRGWHERMNGPETFDIDDYVEQYAAKLRLAGGDGE